MNIFAVKKNVKYLYAMHKVAMLITGVRICSQYDMRAKKSIDDMPSDIEMCASIFNMRNLIVCRKEDGKLKCSIQKDYDVSDSAYVMFKSTDVAIPVLINKMSFSDAFNQSRIVLKGDTQLGMQFVRVLDIVQSCLASPSARKKYLNEKPLSHGIALKIKVRAFFGGII